MHVKTPESALLFDTPGVFARGWYASRQKDELAHLSSERAAACAGLEIMISILNGHKLDTSYRTALFCWDGGRKSVKPRKPKPDGYIEAETYFKQILAPLFGGAHCTIDGFESDDQVATAAVRQKEKGARCCVVSGDKDLQQLVAPLVSYYCLNVKSLINAQYVTEKFCLQQPVQLAARLAVVGDGVDGIGGVYNWGKKKWKDQIMAGLAPQATLSDLIERIERVIPAAQVDNFYQALAITLLDVDVPDVPDPATIAPGDIDLIDEYGLDPVRSAYARFIGEFANPVDVRSEVDAEDY